MTVKIKSKYVDLFIILIQKFIYYLDIFEKFL